MGTIHIGTSGWSYEHWKGPFYAADLPAHAMLARYAERFSTVEINNSFYRLPEAEALSRWRDTVPRDFVFSAKASRYITHMKKLKDPHETLPPFFKRIDVLGDRLGPILFQLPPRWGVDSSRLESFLQALDRRHRYAFEFRDPSWMGREASRLLARYDAAFCIYDLAGRLSPRTMTTDFVYVRLHGPAASYQGSYDGRTLAGWAKTFSALSRQGRAVYCYFNNDPQGHAANNALRLQQMLAAS